MSYTDSTKTQSADLHSFNKLECILNKHKITFFIEKLYCYDETGRLSSIS